MKSKTITILLVDDHPMVRQGLSMFINTCEDLHVIGQAENAVQALELFREHRPDVVLMDMILPEENGITAVENIRAEFPGAKIIALTSFEDPGLIESALLAGCQGFLYKNIDVDELANAIRQVNQGRMVLDPNASEVILQMIHKPVARHEADSKPLSERERAVLALLVKGLTNRQIASQMQLQVSTVKQYISNILSKLGVRSRTEAVALAIQNKLIEP
jgi:NarL family two-component system response regulator LiaR